MIQACPVCGRVCLKEFAPLGCDCSRKLGVQMIDLQCKHCGDILVPRLLTEQHEYVLRCQLCEVEA